MSNTKVKVVIAFLIMVILAVTVGLYSTLNEEQHRQNKELLAYQAEIVSQLLQEEFAHQLQAIEHFELYLTRNGEISRDKFNGFSQRLMADVPYIHNLAWGREISALQRKKFEILLSYLYNKDITITELAVDGQIKVAAKREQHLAIKYSYPVSNNKAAIGFDPSIGKGSLNSLLQAIGNSKATLSEKVRIVQQSVDDNSEKHIVLYVPIFTESPQDLIGYLAIVLDVSALIESILNLSQMQQLNVRVIDNTFSAEKILFQSKADIDWTSEHKHSSDIRVVNKTWTIELLSANKRSQQEIAYLQEISFFIGLFILSLIVIFIIFIRNLVKYEKNIEDKNQQLTESHMSKALLSVTFETHQAIAITDTHGTILRVNKAFCDITGYSEPEVIGENPRMLASGRQSAEFYRNMWHKLNTQGKYTGEIWNRRKSGEVYPEMQTITAIKDVKGKLTHFVSIFTDITQQKQNEEKEKNLALYDPLTMLPNRRLFMDRLDVELAESKRYDGVGGVLVINIDDFDRVNKAIKYHNGDEILIELSARLKQTLRATDTVARMEGDEFIIMVSVRQNVEDVIVEQLLHIAEKIQARVKPDFLIENTISQIRLSIGIALITPKSESGALIVRRASMAMFKAKTMGKNNIVFD